MRILLVAGPFISLRQPYNGGTEASIVMLANELVRQGHQVDVIAKDTDEWNRFNVIEFPESALSMKDDSYRPVTEEVGQQHFQTLQYGLFSVDGYDVIHYNSYITDIYTLGALKQKPSILTLRIPPTDKYAPLYNLFLKQTGAAAVVVSNRMQEIWQDELETVPQVILNGINLEEWQTKAHDSNGYLLWCGRIVREKNVEAAIQLAQHLHKPLKIVGPIHDREYFEQTIKPQLGTLITYVPHASQEHLHTLAAGAAMYLATATWEEPFGLTTIEMLASGVPVLGFTSAVPPELRHPTVSVAVDSKKWQDLSQHVETVSRASSNDCRTFAQLFSIEKTATAYVQLFQQRIMENKA